MKIDFIYGWRWRKRAKGFGLGINFEIYENGIDVIIQLGPAYFGFELYK